MYGTWLNCPRSELDIKNKDQCLETWLRRDINQSHNVTMRHNGKSSVKQSDNAMGRVILKPCLDV
jgi:hypothetical protein